jgi:hypothetical protein
MSSGLAGRRETILLLRRAPESYEHMLIFVLTKTKDKSHLFNRGNSAL